jgi:predicted nuclease with TOPRIM domain
LLELIKSQRFQEEYKSYRSRIDKITNTDTRARLDALLGTLVNEVRKLDNQHQEMFSGNKVPSSLSDSRYSILTVRKKIDTILKDWERSNPAS